MLPSQSSYSDSYARRPVVQGRDTSREQQVSQYYSTDLMDSPSQQDYYDVYDANERFDDDDNYQKHHKIEHHEEVKEISYVYPVLLALLILGALFVPFISLFFFLAVSAFNCNGIGGNSGFGQVTPLFGRRRRKRGIETAGEFAASNRKIYSTGQQLGEENNSKERRPGGEGNTITAPYLPLVMLFDAVSEHLQDESLGELGDYEFWRKQLARNTVKLKRALESSFGSLLDADA